MKIKEGFLLKEVAGTHVVVNTKGTLNFNGMVTLNETGALLWKGITDGLDKPALALLLTSEYDIVLSDAERDVSAFEEKLKNAGILEQ